MNRPVTSADPPIAAIDRSRNTRVQEGLRRAASLHAPQPGGTGFVAA